MSSETAVPQAAPGAVHPTALHGVRVVDLTQYEAGTACTETLAWLGAEVIKIEEPTKGDPGRLGNGRNGSDSYFFMLLNANKHSVTINLKTESGRGLLRSLIERSDVFVENFAPGAIERLGFGYDAVKAINPRIVYAQIKGFAPEGPFGKFLSLDTVAQAVGGSLSVTGERGGRPIRPGLNIGDSGTGIQCALGILAALYQRQFTGVGQRVEITMQESLTNFGRTTYQASAEGRAAQRNGTRSVNSKLAPGDIYPCKGGGPNDYCYIVVSGRNNRHWERLLRVMGREDLIGDPRYATISERFSRVDEVDALVTEWTKQHDKVTVMKLVGEQGVPAGAVFDTEDLINDPALRERGAFVTVNHPVAGEFTMPTLPVKLSASKVAVEPAPLLGANTDEVLGTVLELDDERLAQLRSENAI